MSDNPYQSPASMQLGNVAESPKLGRLIWTVLILDSLPCLFRLSIVLRDAINGVSYHYPAVFFYQQYGFMAGIAGCGLSGNILILLKKRAGIPLAVAGIVLVIAFDGITLWERRKQSGSAFWFMVAAILTRVGWLVFYGIVIRMAARRLARFRREK